MTIISKTTRVFLSLFFTMLWMESAKGFCGFFISKVDAKLFNKASRVVLVRHENKTVITMVNDFQGEPNEFAVVIPVPTFLEREQIHIGNQTIVDHLDAYSAPRLVEYFDPDPCRQLVMKAMISDSVSLRGMKKSKNREDSLGVTIEASYTVGEYDIVILSAKQSKGLETWLKENGYRIPEGAHEVLQSYIKQSMHFFVAQVNVKEHKKQGFRYLRPLQIAYESPRFMLPIRLGTVNAKGTQDLFVYALTRKGRVETTNYRTVKLPSGMDLPVYIKQDFPSFYQDMFSRQVEKENMRVVFLEYAWNMNWCDPCAADPLSRKQLQELGVFWLDDTPQKRGLRGQETFITRLHVRYDAEHFPDDLIFQETADRNNFQGRYVVRHPWKGTEDCDNAQQYQKQLLKRQEREAQHLASLTGWDIHNIREKMGILKSSNQPVPWWKKLWND